MKGLKDKKTIILGISSGIAAYKCLDLVQRLKRKFHVEVIMTKHATHMVSQKEFARASGNKVYTNLFEEAFDYKKSLKNRIVDHITLADRASVVVIAPATANVIAKLAHGLADDFLTTTILATQAPIVVCPSMNVHMWQNPIVQSNLKQLKNRGFIIIEPQEGALACGYEGKGRLVNVEIIEHEIVRIVQSQKKLKGKKILVTAGATIEKIDDVRFITNPSSGKMGAAIADECFFQGADVLLLRARNSVEPRLNIKQAIFQTYDDLDQLVQKHIQDYDICFHTAAVSDFWVENATNGKLSSLASLSLRLQPRKKIVPLIKKLNPQVNLIAFKAEHGLTSQKINVLLQKQKEMHADALVVNDIAKNDRGFGADTNEVVVLKNGKTIDVNLTSKQEVAQKLIAYLV